MEGRIGIIWPGDVDTQDFSLDDDVRIIPGARVAEAAHFARVLIEGGAEILVTTPSLLPEASKGSTVPVIMAYADYIDILETLERAEKLFLPFYKKAALFFHADNPIQLERITAFTRFDLKYVYYQGNEHIKKLISQLKSEGYHLVIGGPTSTDLARREGMETVLIRYRGQSLHSGIQKAREVLKLIQAEMRQVKLLNTVLDIIPDGIVVMDDMGKITMCNKQMAEYVNLDQNELLEQHVEEATQDASWANVYKKAIPQTHILVKYKDNTYFSTRRPVMEGNRAIGAVGILQEARKIQDMERRYRYNQTRGLNAKYHFSDIIYQSSAMRETVNQAEHCALFDATILIEGETGTGKELFAQSIHNASARSKGPFVAVNCAAISPTLLESELMGYEDGAFTGAKRGGKIGLFEKAHNGTIFLDEINQMPVELQPKILRILQERVLMRVGGLDEIPVNVRIIAAANESLAKLVETGKFRRDLYYRLNVFTLPIPPLRQRREDILPLIEYFSQQYRNNFIILPELSPKVQQMLQNYDWPGNVRELQNYIERCVILGPETVNKSFFQRSCEPFAFPKEEEDDCIRLRVSTLRDMERQLVQAVIDRCEGNKSKAALILDINRNTVNNKLDASR